MNRYYLGRVGERAQSQSCWKPCSAVLPFLLAILLLQGCDLACEMGIDTACTRVDKTAPGPVSPFYAIPGDRQVILNWGNPGDSDYAGVRIWRSTTDFPVSEDAGELVVDADRTEISYVDSGLARGTTYYYSAFSYDEHEQVDPAKRAEASATLLPNARPIANTGNDKDVEIGTTVTLDGASSSDPDGDPLTYAWELETPEASTAELSGNTDIQPTFLADVGGPYTATLVVNDSFEDSTPDTVTITADPPVLNPPPTARAGDDQTVTTRQQVTLDGSDSSDPEEEELTYEWYFVSLPSESSLTSGDIEALDAAVASFTPDVDGSYVVGLSVSDGENEDADTMIVTASTENSAPLANAGKDQQVNTGDVVSLDGSASTDVDDDILSYMWSFESVPLGSSVDNLALSDQDSVSATFVPDMEGEYVITLEVDDGTESGIPDDITIFATVKFTSHIAKLLAYDSAIGAEFGSAVAISGNYAIVGSPMDDANGDDSGAAYIFHWNGSAWDSGVKIVPEDASSGAQFGYAVDIYGDFAVVGAPYGDGNSVNSGSVYIFRRTDMNEWNDQVELESSAQDGDEYGRSVAIDGDYVVTGSPRNEDLQNGTATGAAFAYRRTGTNEWLDWTSLYSPDAEVNDSAWFGWSIAMSGQYTIVGAPLESSTETNQGAGYIFFRTGQNQWDGGTRLVAEDAQSNDNLGLSVSIGGDYAAIGSIEEDPDGVISAGSVYVFQRTGTNDWNDQTKLIAIDPVEGDNFGISVALFENRIIIGAYNADDQGTDSGAVYVIRRIDANTWIAELKVFSSDGEQSFERFGRAVDINSDLAIVGAYRDNEGGSGAGSVFVLE